MHQAKSMSSSGPMQTVFLIEDHPAMRRMLRRLLEEETDLTVIGEAASAEAAVVHLTPLHPDIVLVDLSLPGMSGVELVGLLKKRRPDLRCLVVTGHVDPIYRAAATMAGAAGYVTKDDPDRVLAAVRAALAT